MGGSEFEKLFPDSEIAAFARDSDAPTDEMSESSSSPAEFCEMLDLRPEIDKMPLKTERTDKALEVLPEPPQLLHPGLPLANASPFISPQPVQIGSGPDAPASAQDAIAQASQVQAVATEAFDAMNLQAVRLPLPDHSNQVSQPHASQAVTSTEGPEVVFTIGAAAQAPDGRPSSDAYQSLNLSLPPASDIGPTSTTPLSQTEVLNATGSSSACNPILAAPTVAGVTGSGNTGPSDGKQPATMSQPQDAALRGMEQHQSTSESSAIPCPQMPAVPSSQEQALSPLQLPGEVPAEVIIHLGRNTVQAEAPAALAPSLPNGPEPRDILRHMPGQLQPGDQDRIEITLTPEELGKMRVVITPGDTPAVSILADSRDTLDLLRRHGELLARELRDIGFAGASLSFGEGNDRAHRNPNLAVAATGSAAPAASGSPSAEPPPGISRGGSGRRLDIRI